MNVQGIKSYKVAYILLLFLGWTGVHRFYIKGKPLTLALFFVLTVLLYPTFGFLYIFILYGIESVVTLIMVSTNNQTYATKMKQRRRPRKAGVTIKVNNPTEYMDD